MTESSDLPWGDDDNEVVGSGGDKNLSKSKSKFKKSKNTKSGVRRVLVLRENLHS